MSMKFVIDHGIFEKFPGLHIGVIAAKDIDNKGESKEVQKLLAEQQELVKTINTKETLLEHQKIKTWKKAYTAFGAKPKEHKSSVEKLYEQVLRGDSLRHINKLVDIYNFISLKHMLPAGGEDIDKMQGDIRLTFAKATEPAVLLLGDKEPRPPHVDEVIYKDEISAICRRWNWKEADRTKLSGGTKNCILVIEGIPPITREEVKAAIHELKGLIEKHCGGKDLPISILDVTNTVFILDQDVHESR